MRRDLGQTGSVRVEESGVFHRSIFRVGGVSVALGSQRRSDVSLGPELEPFRVETSASEIDIDIQIVWAAELPWTPGRPRFDSGTTWRLYEGETGFQFDFNVPALGEQPYKRLFTDRHFRKATVQMSEESFAGTAKKLTPLAYPLDELLIMHRLTQEKAIELHGCGIVMANGAGNLFVGHSGAGKSTTTRLWTAREDVEVLSDDRIIVRRDTQRKRTHRCARRMRMFGTPWHGEAAYASPGNAVLSRIFILEHGHGNVLTPLSSSQAVAELFARSFVPFHRHEYVHSALEFLDELVAAVPCYHYAFEPNERAVERILGFRD